MSTVFLNGKFLFETQASIPVTDRGFLFGDGVFTTIKVQDGLAECLQRHLERIKLHCQALNITPPIIQPANIEELISHNKAQKGSWRLKIIVTGGSEPELDLRERLPGQVFISLKPTSILSFEPIRLCLYPTPILSPSAKLKTLSYLDKLWVKEYARGLGYADALVMNSKGYLMECALSNFFWKKGKVLYFPKHDLSFLMGITVDLIETAAKQMGYSIQHAAFKFEEMPKEAQLFTCNSLTGPCPVLEVEEQFFERDFDFESKLNRAYLELIASSK